MKANQLNLLVINQYASTPAYSSGAGERHFYLSEKLKQFGFNSTIVSGGYNHLFLKAPEIKGLFTEEIIKGGKFMWIKQFKYNGKSFLGRALSWIEFLIKLFFLTKKRIGTPDIVIVSSMSLFPSIYAIFLKKRFDIPFILEIRDIWPLTPMQLGGYSKKNPFIRVFAILEKLAYKNADAFITLLPSFSKHLQSLSLKEKPVYWIPNAIDDSFLKNQSPAEIEDHKNENEFVIGYTGALGIANAMDCFIDAAKIIGVANKNIKFLIIGNGPEKEQLKSRAGSQANIQFLDKVPKDKVINVLKNVDVCFISWHNIQMYEYGVSANKYNDYMLAGKPILSASNIPDDPVLMAKCGIRVESGNAEAISKAILDLYSMSKPEREVLGINGYNYVMQNNTYEVIAEKYKTCIHEVLASKSQK